MNTRKNGSDPRPRSRIRAAQTEAATAALAPRKIPRQQRAAATIAAILDAAASILESKGFEGYNTNAIAERAGVSIGSLYQYFPNKSALSRALIEREDAALVNDLTPLMAKPEGTDLLRDLIRVCLAHEMRRPLLSRLLDIEEARLPSDEQCHRMSELLEAIFRRGLAKTSAAQDPHATQDLLAIIHGMADLAGQRGESDSIRLKTRIERALFGYIGTFEH